MAAALAAAGRAVAAKGDAIADIDAAINEIGGLLAEPKRAEILALPGGQGLGQGLLESLQDRRAGLQRHSKWLADRAELARRITAMEALLVGPPDGANETKCLTDIDDVGSKFPAVVDDDDAGEPADARTKSEQRVLEGIQSRASFRREQHEAMTAAAPEDKFRRLQAFLEDRPSAPDPRDARLLEEAQRELGVARLAVLRARAEEAETADGMAKALKLWLAAPPAGPDNRKAEALAVIKSWLDRNVPTKPKVADQLRGLQETIMLFKGEEKRMLGWFEPTPNEPGKWRFWWDRADRADPDYKRGRGDVPVPAAKAPMNIPVFVEIEATYGPARKRLLGDPLGEGVAEAFAQESGKLAERTATHRAIPANTNAPHEFQGSYDNLGEELEAACKKATDAADEFDEAAKKNALRNLLVP
jgi:hypothetical protein